MCEHCKLAVHLNCANFNLKIENSKIASLWSYHACTLRELPLYHQYVLPMNKKEVTVDHYINTHVTKLQELKLHISYVILIYNQWHRHLTSSNSWSTNRNSTYYPIQDMVKERQTSVRICQFAWLQILLQKQR